jgi:hypothetical protein
MPGTYPLSLYRGDSYTWQFRLWSDPAHTQPVDLTGATVKAEVRYTPGGTAILALDCTITAPNIIGMHLPADAWDGFVMTKTGTAAWDLQVSFPGGDVITYLAGPVTLTADITDSVAPAIQAARRRI